MQENDHFIYLFIVTQHKINVADDTHIVTLFYIFGTSYMCSTCMLNVYDENQNRCLR